MLVLKIEKMIVGTKDTKRKNMKELSISSILSKICIHNDFRVLVLCNIIVDLNTESWRVQEHFERSRIIQCSCWTVHYTLMSLSASNILTLCNNWFSNAFNPCARSHVRILMRNCARSIMIRSPQKYVYLWYMSYLSFIHNIIFDLCMGLTTTAFRAYP